MLGMLKALATTEATVAACIPVYQSDIACITLVLPISTAGWEKCFLTLKRVNIELRNRLIITILDQLLWTSICGPELKEFAFNQAEDEWGAMRNRRIQI